MKQIRPLDVPFTSRILVAITLGSFMLQVLGDKVIQSDLETLSETLTEIIFEGVRPQERGYDS
jgi:hypothetical protein